MYMPQCKYLYNMNKSNEYDDGEDDASRLYWMDWSVSSLNIIDYASIPSITTHLLNWSIPFTLILIYLDLRDGTRGTSIDASSSSV